MGSLITGLLTRLEGGAQAHQSHPRIKFGGNTSPSDRRSGLRRFIHARKDRTKGGRAARDGIEKLSFAGGHLRHKSAWPGLPEKREKNNKKKEGTRTRSIFP